MERDYKISIIRILAMLSIVLCHIFQAFNMNIAFWLNVGVQVFLFMSGFLYGNKTIENTWDWLKKQFKKIIIPYYIYIAIIILAYVILARNEITVANITSIIFQLQLIILAPRGLGHFWFIPVILICYLITPLLQKIIKKEGKITVNQIAVLLLVIIGIESLFLQSVINIGLCNIICYILGYTVANMYLKNKKAQRVTCLGIVILAIIANVLKVFILPDEYNVLISSILKVIIFNSHILLGSAIFIVLFKLLSYIEKKLNPTIKTIIDNLDKNSFYVYITHHTFILGPLAIINLTPYIWVNILLIFWCILISSCVLSKIISLVKKE